MQRGKQSGCTASAGIKQPHAAVCKRGKEHAGCHHLQLRAWARQLHPCGKGLQDVEESYSLAGRAVQLGRTAEADGGDRELGPRWELHHIQGLQPVRVPRHHRAVQASGQQQRRAVAGHSAPPAAAAAAAAAHTAHSCCRWRLNLDHPLSSSPPPPPQLLKSRSPQVLARCAADPAGEDAPWLPLQLPLASANCSGMSASRCTPAAKCPKERQREREAPSLPPNRQATTLGPVLAVNRRPSARWSAQSDSGWCARPHQAKSRSPLLTSKP